MGSLMPGWDSRIIDKRTAHIGRNKSLTKEEINAFWRSKSPRNNDETDTSLSPFGSASNSPVSLDGTEKRRVAVPFSHSQNKATEEATGQSDKITGAWWTRSNSAFLNEPPLDEMYGKAHKYTTQFDVGRLATGND